MAILQISKIQHRSGNLVDLPQLSEAELGWASDDKRLFIGKESPPENIEILTMYSKIYFSQIEGVTGNANIDANTLQNGQVFAYDGTYWTNKGGIAGGLITLGDVGNVKLDGGGIGYVLETDGAGNLSWTPKGTLIAYLLNVTQDNPAVATTLEDNFFIDGNEVTITGVTGMTELNANNYFVKILTANTFELYEDSALANAVDSTGFGQYAYSTATYAEALSDAITVADSGGFTTGDQVVFRGDVGNSGIDTDRVYYISAVPNSTEIAISESNGGANYSLVESAMNAELYAPNARVIHQITNGSGGIALAAGSTYSVQYNYAGAITGDSQITWNPNVTPRLFNVSGNANVSNLNSSGVVTGTRLLSNVATGTAPLQVVSTTRVSNLNVSYANVSDYTRINPQTTGTFYPVVTTATSAGNYQPDTTSAFSFNIDNGTFTATVLTGSLSTAAQPNITQIGTLGNLTVTSNILAGNVFANSGTVKGFYLTGTLTTAVQPNITQVGTLVSLDVTGNVVAGNVYANAGSVRTTTLTVDANLFANSANVKANNISANTVELGNVFTRNVSTGGSGTTGNITGNWTLTSGSKINGVVVTGSNVIGTVANANHSVYAENVLNAAQPNITSLGTLTGLNMGGHILPVANNQYDLGENTNRFRDLYLSGSTITLGDITLTTDSLIPSGNTVLVVSDYLEAKSVSAGSADLGNNVTANYVTGTLTTAAQPNITSVGTLSSLKVTADVESGNVYANTGTINATNLGGILTTASQTNITSVGTLTSLEVSGNTTSGNIYANSGTVGAQYVVGTLTTPVQTFITRVGTLVNLTVSGNTAVNGNLSVGSGNVNISSTGNITAAGGTSHDLGNVVQANFFLGDGGLLSNIPVSVINGFPAYSRNCNVANVANNVAFSSQPNITSLGNLLNLTVDGNIIAKSNVQVTGTIIVPEVYIDDYLYANTANVYARDYLLTRNLTTGANTTQGNITGNWVLTPGSKMESTSSDLAEFYLADQPYESGTVLAFGGEKEVTIAEDGTRKVAGVVSECPAYVMNTTMEGQYPVMLALQGRVPCKVRGKIEKGDMMISAGSGFARACSQPLVGSVIGKSLENFDGVEGVIEIAVGRL